jgi:hypothetical protein
MGATEFLDKYISKYVDEKFTKKADKVDCLNVSVEDISSLESRDAILTVFKRMDKNLDNDENKEKLLKLKAGISAEIKELDRPEASIDGFTAFMALCLSILGLISGILDNFNEYNCVGTVNIFQSFTISDYNLVLYLLKACFQSAVHALFIGAL